MSRVVGLVLCYLAFAIGQQPSSSATPPKPASADTTVTEWAALEAANKGATSFFVSFDRDGNKKWSHGEWNDALRISIQQGYIPPNFKIQEEWVKLPKDDEGQITLKTFIDFSSKTAAHTPPPFQPPAPDNTTKPYQNCKEIFDAFDSDHDGGLNRAEFNKAMEGKIASDALNDIWYNQQRKGPVFNGQPTFDFETFRVLCKSVTGLPGTDKDSQDPCTPNPCLDVSTVCVVDHKQCFAPPCPQFKCLPKPDVTQGGQPEVSEYGKCVRMFQSYTAAGSNGPTPRRSMSEREFANGIRDMQGATTISYQFNAAHAWKLFDKTPTGELDLYEFVKFCIAVTATGADADRSAKEECWEVFTHFDKDGSEDIDSKEFLRGMRHAARNGHMPPINTLGAWCAFPKSSSSTIDVTTFIRFCLKVSKNIPVEEAPCFPPPAPTLAVNGTLANGTLANGTLASGTLAPVGTPLSSQVVVPQALANVTQQK